LSPILDAEPGPETDRSRLFDAVTRFLAEESLEQPLLIVLDDLHRADHASLGLLRFLAPIVRDSRLLVIGTYRGGEIPTAHPLARLVADVVGGVGVDVLALDGLTRRETALLVARMAPAGASLSVEELHERSGGNPFFLTEILRLAPEATDEVPATVSAAISARLDRSPSPATPWPRTPSRGNTPARRRFAPRPPRCRCADDGPEHRSPAGRERPMTISCCCSIWSTSATPP
jgi:AAA ATPase domain